MSRKLFSLIKRSIKIFDNHENGLVLSFNKRPRHQTLFGGAFTILIIIGFTFLIFLFIPSFGKKGNIDVISGLEYSSVTPLVDLIENNFYPIIVLMKDGKYVNTDDFFRYVGMVSAAVTVNYKSVSDLETEDEENGTKINFIGLYQPCKDVNTKAKEMLYGNDPNFMKIGETHGFCLSNTDDAQMLLQSSIHQPPYKFFAFFIYPCVNNPEYPPNFCFPSEELDSIELHFILPETYLDLENEKHPVSYSPKVQIKLDINRFWRKDVKLVLKENKIYDIYDIYNTKTLRETFIDIDQISQAMFHRNSTDPECVPTGCDELMEIIFEIGGRKRVLVRKFPVSTRIFSEMGGLIEAIETVIFLLYLFCSRTFSKKRIETLIFGKEDKGSFLLEKQEDKEYNERKEMKKQALNKLLDGTNLVNQHLFAKIIIDIFMQKKICDRKLVELIFCNIRTNYKKDPLGTRTEWGSRKASTIIEVSKYLKTPQKKVAKFRQWGNTPLSFDPASSKREINGPFTKRPGLFPKKTNTIRWIT